ncbi:hypothetical protein C8F04DRAFT_1394125 [Mycena alexandri]|uniref:F-box domain-containing protein n=1 Tax=Mycena alexandri TaxID=1745969 RepID=A0AAD6SZH1_9AGAR|nr:hypothetical protein C8F04DRAFT_1394125 [Mycena alexandri]
MVLTRRASKSIVRWLPNEVISEIIQAAPPRDQASLCRATKLFEGLGVPILYRVVDLKTGASTKAFCSTIASYTAKFAKLVRSLTFDTYAPPVNEFTVPRALFKCMKVLLEIRSLDIRGTLPYLSLTFPRLLHCRLHTFDRHWDSNEDLDTLSSFLARHPTLRPSWPSTAARIPLPDLQRIRASAKIFPRILADDLKEARLEWEFGGKADMWPPEPIFLALKATTRRDNSLVCSIYCGHFEFPPIMDSASMHIPHAKTLRVVTVLEDPDDPDSEDPHRPDDKIQHVKKWLPRFIGLEFFALELYFDEEDGCNTFGATEAEDQLTVHDFGDLCSTLRACRLGENAWRRVNGTWERFPADDFLALAGITLVDWSG